MTDPRERRSLEDRLADLGGLIAPVDADLQLSTRAPSGSRWSRVAAAAAVFVVAAVLAIAPARTAVADWLGIGSTSITVDDELPPATADDPPAPPSEDSLATIRTNAAADLGIDIALPSDPTLGNPVGWEIREAGPIRELVVDWVDVRITAWPAGDGAPIRKVTTQNPVLDDRLPTDGEPAYWIEGPHARELGDETVLVDSTLLWVRDGIEYRLSGPDLTLDRAVEIAATQG